MYSVGDRSSPLAEHAAQKPVGGTFMLRRLFGLGALVALAASPALAQLPPDAVDLGKVKISEKFKAEGAESEEQKLDRWTKNYVDAMSLIWCPVTDEVNPGGLLQWTVEGITWESCCAFCDESVKDDDFVGALERLKERAKKSYELTGGKYVEGAKSPIDGAIKDAKAPKEVAAAAAGAAPAAASEPAWLAGKPLKPTYAEGIGIIFDNRCNECHHKGAAAPMAFTTLPEIKKWAKGLKDSVVNREMPPWPADPAVGAFANSKHLTQKEIDLISEWAKAGFPAGTGTFTAAEQTSTGEGPDPSVAPAGLTLVKAENLEFVIPAGAEKFETTASYTFDKDATIVTLQPILMQRGKAISVSAKTPDGKTTELLSIPIWSNDWKYRYELAAPLKAAKGTVIEVNARYDNSKLNFANPDPSKDVKAGDGEVCEVWIGVK